MSLRTIYNSRLVDWEKLDNLPIITEAPNPAKFLKWDWTYQLPNAWQVNWGTWIVWDINNQIDLQTALWLKANQSTTYTKTEVDNALWLKANTSSIYTQTQLNNWQLDNRYYTETEIDNKLVQATETTLWLVEIATDVEVSTWTDTIRYVSPKQIKDNYWFTYATKWLWGGFFDISAWWSAVFDTTTYTKVKEVEAWFTWVMRINFWLEWTTSWQITYTVYWWIYKNWVYVTERSFTWYPDKQSEVFTLDLPVSQWDLVQIYWKVNDFSWKVSYLDIWYYLDYKKWLSTVNL
jgi:hypothetical protein